MPKRYVYGATAAATYVEVKKGAPPVRLVVEIDKPYDADDPLVKAADPSLFSAEPVDVDGASPSVVASVAGSDKLRRRGK